MFDYEYWGNADFPGSINMALEEFMLNRASQGKAMVRFYSFSGDTIVLGYAQATDAIRSRGIDIVRRATGGSHVQTGKNILAYSFAVPRDGSFAHFEDMRAYYAGHIAKAFMSIGIENVEVDNAASSVNINEKVAAAHAMIWGVESALLHGLIVIDPYDMEKLAQRISLGTRIIGGKVYSDYDAIRNIPAIAKVLPGLAKDAVERSKALRNIVAETILYEVTKGKHDSKAIDDRIIKMSYPLMEKRYGKRAWTDERKPAFTEEQIEEIPGEKLEGPLKKKLGYCMYLQVKDSDFKKMASKE